MYKNIIATVMLAIAATNGFSQSTIISNTLPIAVRNKMDLPLLSKLNNISMASDKTTVPLRNAATEEQQISAIVRMQPGYDTSCLSNCGVKITASAMGFATVKASIGQLTEIAADKRVKHMSLTKSGQLCLDRMHPRTGVDRIKTGDGLQQPYTGKGVLALMEDVGIQPTHTMLLNEDGTPKIEYFYGADGKVSTTREELDTIHDTFETHATHTSTILLGSKVTSNETSYEGVAPGASMAFFQADIDETGVITDLTTALTALASYAEKQTERPMVANFSLGTNATAFTDDEDDDALAMLNKLGEKIPVCVSVGNMGFFNSTVSHKYSESGEKLLFYADAYEPGYYLPENVAGAYYISCQTEKPVKVTVMLVKDKEILYKMPVIDKSTEGKFTYLSALAEDADNDEYLHNDEFAEHYGGRIGICSRMSENGRYQVMITRDSVNQVRNKYKIAFLVEGDNNQYVKASGYGYAYLSEADEGIVDGAITDCITADGNGDEWAFAKNVISVGAYSSRLSDSEIEYGYGVIDSLAIFSSFATLFDGRTLPYITAPGQYIIAGFNKYYNGEKPTAYIDGSDDALISYEGTSMASPCVAGIIALWLEADPTLSVADVKEIMASTAIKDKYVTSSNSIAWGNGKIDAYNGLKEVLNRASSGLHTISTDKDFMLRQEGRQVEVFVAGETSLTAQLYNMNGKLVANANGTGNCLTLNASAAPSGIYVLHVEGSTTSHSAKIMIK